MSGDSVHSSERERRWGEVLAAWLEAVEQGRPPDRDVWLARHPEFAAEMAEFFASQDQLQRLAAPLRPADGAEEPAGAGKPHAFGDYELLGEVGRGGMSVVYRARQKSPDRTVALKILRADPLVPERQVQRFRNEADLAAQLDHPHIVPIYEVGEHDGRVYFSMKLMEGGNLAERLSRLGDDPRAAARLVADVARAVHHAHQRGILHRDLKPSNILLDTAGRPHVSDFGLAKRIEADASLTPSGAVVGTPAYLAPEQAAARRGAVTTATDVYGLGAVLYAVLTGNPPFQGETVLDTLERVKGQDPEPPGRSNPRVDRDLETVCLTCLHKEPSRRYGSAEALAEDLERWLAGVPVRARRTPAWERAWKWARRRPVAALLAVGGPLAGLSLVLAILWHNHRLQAALGREQQQRREAARQRDRARDRGRAARKAVDEMYTQVAEDWLAQQPHMEPVQREFLRKALAFYQEFAREEGDDPEARHGAAGAYRRVGEIHQAVGETAEAEEAYTRAFTLLEGLADEFPSEPGYRRDRAHVLGSLGVLAGVGRAREAEALHRQAVTLRAGLVADFPDVPDYRGDLAGSYQGLAKLLLDTGRPEEAERLNQQGLELMEKLTADFPGRPQYRRRLASLHNNQALLLKVTGRRQEAEKLYRRGVGLYEQLVAELPASPVCRRELAGCCSNLGNLLRDLGQLKEAEEVLRRSVGLREQLHRDFPGTPDHLRALAHSHNNLGRVLADAGRPAEAEAAYLRAIELQQKLAAAFPDVPGFRHEAAIMHNNLGWLLATSADAGVRDPARAVEVAKKAVELAQPPPAGHWNTLGVSHYRAGDWRAAVQALEKAVQLGDGGVAQDWLFLAMAHGRLGDKGQARAWYDRAVRWMDEHPPQEEEVRRFRDEAAGVLGLPAPPMGQTKKVSSAKE